MTTMSRLRPAPGVRAKSRAEFQKYLGIQTASNGALTYTHEFAVYWIAWKQELRDRDRAKQRKEQKL